MRSISKATKALCGLKLTHALSFLTEQNTGFALDQSALPTLLSARALLCYTVTQPSGILAILSYQMGMEAFLLPECGQTQLQG